MARIHVIRRRWQIIAGDDDPAIYRRTDKKMMFLERGLDGGGINRPDCQPADRALRENRLKMDLFREALFNFPGLQRAPMQKKHP